MSSASQSKPGVEDASQLLGDVEALSAQRWRLASPVWFPLLCTAIATLASVPAGILLDGENAAGYVVTSVSVGVADPSGRA